eukprot:CAMPEP_0119554238 /NCGR_PEP_ID=MMETSP1352-20130426/6786_1 /TAXON_ID=265584 /ORGANISM="Stauroneis constricta, Strain CCMP1120" /LENGTH=348 /DNA_ID=CAMNT_0007600801 /DNA_START=94 /DNA_END=1140 /DNA_ORIENTATION=-
MHRARSFDPLPTVDEEAGCSKRVSPTQATATSSSSPSLSLLPLLCKEGTYFYRLGQSFNASSIRIVNDPPSSLPPRKSATHLRNRSAQSFEDDFRPIRIVVGDNDDDQNDGDARPTTGRRCCDRRHRSAPALRQDECASESLPRMPKRAWTSPSISEMKNADFHNDDSGREQSSNGTSKARKLALIFDMMMTPSNNGDGAAAKPIRAQHSRKRRSYPGGTPLQLPSNFSNGSSNNNAGPTCRWSESSDHSTDSLPPIRPSRLDSLTKSDGNVGEDEEASITDTLDNSFASFCGDSEDDSGESIVTLHSSCLSFSESFNKSYSSHESDLVPFPGPPCISEQQSPGAQAA